MNEFTSSVLQEQPIQLTSCCYIIIFTSLICSINVKLKILADLYFSLVLQPCYSNYICAFSFPQTSMNVTQTRARMTACAQTW